MIPGLFSLTSYKIRHINGCAYLNNYDGLDIEPEHVGSFTSFHKAVSAMKKAVASSYDDYSWMIPLGYLIEELDIDSDTISYSPLSFASFDAKGDLLEMFTFDETLPEPNYFNRRKNGDTAFKVGDILISVNAHIYCMVTGLPKSSDDSPISDMDNQYEVGYVNGDRDDEMPIFLFPPTIMLNNEILLKFDKLRKTIK